MPTPTTMAAAGPTTAEHRVAAIDGVAAERRDRDEHALGDAQRHVPRDQEHAESLVNDSCGTLMAVVAVEEDAAAPPSPPAPRRPGWCSRGRTRAGSRARPHFRSPDSTSSAACAIASDDVVAAVHEPMLQLGDVRGRVQLLGLRRSAAATSSENWRRSGLALGGRHRAGSERRELPFRLLDRRARRQQLERERVLIRVSAAGRSPSTSRCSGPAARGRHQDDRDQEP